MHVNCWDKEPKLVLKFFNHPQYGFVCPSCYTSGHTFQKLCSHLMDHHSSEDLVKMGVSTIHVACGASGLYRQNTDDAFNACTEYMDKQKVRLHRPASTRT